jgi:uncharacterized protein (DUF111 family)
MAIDCLVIRAPSGMGGDMLAAGLARLLALDQDALSLRVRRIGLAALEGTVMLEPRNVNGISGWGMRVTLPRQHVHRTLSDIEALIAASALGESSRAIAQVAFERLAKAEAEVHDIPPDQVHFHEVGALDSVLDVCLVADLYVELGSPQVVCSPLPVSDGVVHCDHGMLATPAPAVLQMLEGVPVYGIEGAGETVTPTALALLHALGTQFGPWPALTVKRTTRAYGTRVISGVPNGAIFACGSTLTNYRSPALQSKSPRKPFQDHEHSHDDDVAHGHHAGNAS